MKPVACMYPKILSFKNAVRTNCPAELQPDIEGSVAWSAEVYVEDYSVTDKNGVTHSSYPLYSEADVQSLQAERDRLNASLAEAQAERDRLREALEMIVNVTLDSNISAEESDIHCYNIARAALSKALGE